MAPIVSTPASRPPLASAWVDLGERIEGLVSLPNDLPELIGGGAPGLELGDLRARVADDASS